MRFLCLVYFEPEAVSGLSPREKATLDRDSLAYDEELRRRGRYMVAEALDPVSRARTIRLRRGTRAITDGPFAELAAGIPLAKLGSIEVRPVMTMSG